MICENCLIVVKIDDFLLTTEKYFKSMSEAYKYAVESQYDVNEDKGVYIEIDDMRAKVCCYDCGLIFKPINKPR